MAAPAPSRSRRVVALVVYVVCAALGCGAIAAVYGLVVGWDDVNWTLLVMVLVTVAIIESVRQGRQR